MLACCFVVKDFFLIGSSFTGVRVWTFLLFLLLLVLLLVLLLLLLLFLVILWQAGCRPVFLYFFWPPQTFLFWPVLMQVTTFVGHL